MVTNHISMEFVNDKNIKLNKYISLLDDFTLKFVKHLSKFSKYVLISGYVSILLGRSRMSEDVDIIIPPLKFNEFSDLVEELSSEFYCLNTDSKKEMFEYLSSGVAIRFAFLNQIIPNMELKFAKTKIDYLVLEKKIEVHLGKKILYISPLELQIAYKEVILKSPKDLEDALHLRIVAEKNIDLNLIKEYKRILNE
ncbi:MAG: hypothetical protein AB7V77_05765 [Candidatus Woesearchaeota archaeon]